MQFFFKDFRLQVPSQLKKTKHMFAKQYNKEKTGGGGFNSTYLGNYAKHLTALGPTMAIYKQLISGLLRS